jgi:hypothetical protein
MTINIVSRVLGLAMVGLLLQAEAPFAQTSATSKAGIGTTETGIAIFYNDAMQGKVVASGEKYDKDALISGTQDTSSRHDGQSDKPEEQQERCREGQ